MNFLHLICQVLSQGEHQYNFRRRLPIGIARSGFMVVASDYTHPVQLNHDTHTRMGIMIVIEKILLCMKLHTSLARMDMVWMVTR